MNLRSGSNIPPVGVVGRVWWQFREFSAVGGDATFLWTRWIVLRAVGIVYISIFAGILAEGRALIAPNGIAQLAEFFDQARKTFPFMPEALIRAPSLFWLDTGTAMIGVLAWAGLIAAVALVLNLWPRMALFGCWLIFLSFASSWRSFSPAQLDNLMIEVALLCVPFAPAGWRPGLGLSSPPRPITVLMLRWLLFRVMFESGLVKLVSGDPHWRNLTAMETMYETSPFPTILGFLDHQMPQAYHLLEIALTFVAELVAPVVAVLGGRRGRWFAFVAWVMLQAGIQLTNNFGWLNAAAIGQGFMLLDDQMLAAAAEKLRLRRLASFLSTTAAGGAAGIPGPWPLYGLRLALCIHFYLTLFYFAKACGLPPGEIPRILAAPADLVREFRSVNGYYLYATFEPVRFQVEFAGSNDGGRTWRVYPYRHIPQRIDRICPFIAPWFYRFEATMEIEGWSGRKSPVFPAVAAHLLARNASVISLFERDPFPDRPPTMIRMRGYRMAFTDFETYRKTGNFWRREPDGEYLPMLALDERGQLAEFTLAEGDAALAKLNRARAVDIFQQQYQAGFLPAGFRLAEVYARGLGGPPDPAKALALYFDLAKEGEVVAEHYLGVFHELGLGVGVDFAQAAHWYGRAAQRGYLPALFNLGKLHAEARITPRDDVAGLAMLLEASERAKADDAPSRYVRENQPMQVKRIKERMTPRAISESEQRVAKRPQRTGLRP
ncbi:MAG: lipase maturation factor family protein [Verrucomicrobia bacterium]|nr:lipase maturation factor family protein [Verrucomicrobiota bacterium]